MRQFMQSCYNGFHLTNKKWVKLWMFDYCSLTAPCFLLTCVYMFIWCNDKKCEVFVAHPFDVLWISSDHRQTLTYCCSLSFTIKSVQDSHLHTPSPPRYIFIAMSKFKCHKVFGFHLCYLCAILYTVKGAI